MDRTEAQGLMRAVAAGDRRALARLIEAYGPGVQRYAAQVLADPAEAEDIAQEVFLRAWGAAARYDPARGAVSTWLWRIAVRLCLDRNRRGAVRRFLGLDAAAEPADPAVGAETTLAARQDLACVRRAIGALPDRQRQAILLRAVGDLDTAEIAAVLGTSRGAVEQLLVRARAALRRQIAG